jgi:hypothetical protein
MKRLILSLFVSAAAISAHAALSELNVAEGTIESPDGNFVGRDFTVVNGFKLELLYRPPADQGKWVAMGWDNKHRLVIPSYNSDRLVRVTVPDVGKPGEVKAELLTGTRVGAAEGVLYAFDSLYISVNRSNSLRSGLYRLKDTNGDDKYDQTRVVRVRQGDASDHGTHTIQLNPDGKMMSVISGNATRLTEYNRTRVYDNWGEDRLIIRPDLSPPGFHRAPEANIVNFNADGSDVELWAMGMRNPVSHAFNKDGEMFVYDADEEPNMGFTVGYRPTDVLHVISGADVGWRAGAKVHPYYYFDNIGMIAQVGSGSPVGSGFGTGTKFPARYQDAFFIDDWSFGNLWAVMLNPDGSSYQADVQPFVSGRPFAVSGTIANEADGSLLVQTTGTELYRITYVGNEPTTPTKPDTRFKALRDLRHDLEKFHGKKDATAVNTVWPYLSDSDKAIRYAARTALEFQDVNSWRERAINEVEPRKAIAAIASLARVTAPDDYHVVPGTTPNRDKNLESRMLQTLDRIEWRALSYQDKLDLLRAYQLVMIRLGMPNPADVQRVIARLDPYLPATQMELNRELSEVLIYLQAPSAATKVMALLRNAPSQPYYGIQEWINPQQRQRQDGANFNPAAPNVGKTQASLMRQDDQQSYAMMLRTLKAGWTPELRKEFLEWFVTAPKEWTGAVANNLNNIRLDYVSQMTDAEKTEFATLISTPITNAAGGGRGGAGAAAPGGAAGAPGAGAAAFGGGARGGGGTPGLGAPAASLYIPSGGANRAFTDVELTAIARYDESMEKEIKAVSDASDALIKAQLTLPTNSAEITAQVNALAVAEQALAMARASGMTKLKTDLKLSAAQIAVLPTAVTVRGGRGTMLGGGAGAGAGAGGRGGAAAPAAGRGN